MSLNGALSIASGSLANINRQLTLLSHNVANAGTPGYVTETATQSSLSAEGVELGVRAGPAIRNLDAALQAAMRQMTTTVADLRTRQSAMAAIDAAQGTPGQGNDLPTLLGNLHDQFSILLNDPSSQTQQTQVVAAAATLARGINALSDAYTAQRQAAQDDLVSAVDAANTTLGDIGNLSNRIINLKSTGQSTADLENQRDAAVQNLAQLVGIKALAQANGDMLITTTGGLALRTRGIPSPLSTSGANMQPGGFSPGGGIPPINLGGIDVTAALAGGRIGGDVTLRDATLPTYQAELDEFAQNLAHRFDAQGLPLFTGPTGVVPAGGGQPTQAGYVGFAAIIQVNPAVRLNPALVRDGSLTIVGSPTGASDFTPNPPGGLAGFSTLITRVLSYALGAEAQAGVPQPASNTARLGPSGTLATPYVAPATLGGIATALVAAQAEDSAQVSGQLGTEQAVQTTLTNQFTAASGVNMDAQMSTMIQLQNAYGVTAKVIGAVQAMWAQLLATVQ